MGWAVGEHEGRHIGYGVPALCDYPECGERIDRGLAYACGGGVVGKVENCGLFFCGKHLSYFVEDGDGGESVCERCANDEPSFDPTPDTAEWIEHVLTDPSWAGWRKENPAHLADWQSRLAHAPP